MTTETKFRKCHHDFEWESGYGFAGGGLGSYEYQSCKKCGALGDKTRNFIPDKGDAEMTTETKFRREFSERELLEFVLPTKQNAYDIQRVLKDLVFEVEKMYELLDRAVEMAEWYAYDKHIEGHGDMARTFLEKVK